REHDDGEGLRRGKSEFDPVHVHPLTPALGAMAAEAFEPLKVLRTSSVRFQVGAWPSARASSATRRHAGRDSPCGRIACSLSCESPFAFTNVPSASAQLEAGKTTFARAESGPACVESAMSVGID